MTNQTATQQETLEYNYDLQVWVINGIIAECGHPVEMKCTSWCNKKKYTGKTIEQAKKAEGGK